MRSRMHPKYYLSPEIFSREQQKIFRKVWLFAGLKTLLPHNNSFITSRLAGIPVVIQNFQGELRAFENVCLHRGSRIQSEPAGCRPLVCPYHAWSYDASGGVRNIPDCDRIYRFDQAEKQALKLREFALRAVGNVLFVNLDAQPLPFEEQFSPEFIALLESASSLFDAEVMTTTLHGKFNWKLAYENLRDQNHPRFVHGGSLAKAVAFMPGVNEDELREAESPMADLAPAAMRREMRRFSTAGPDADVPGLKRFDWHRQVRRWGDQDVYYNWLAFPNLHIASVGGYSFALEHHMPIAPDRTDVQIYWLTARKKQPYPSSHQALLVQMHGGQIVLGEDVEAMENVQAALHDEAPLPNQGAYESMNRLVERWYATLMETDHGL